MGPKRREIGHGRLAKRGVLADAVAGSLPVHHPRRLGNHRVERFLVDGLGLRFLAGPDGRRRAGEGAGGRYRHGLVKEGERFVVLSDILGDEDHLGDMDFKVAGTAEGISALQMDIKIEGITEEIMKQACSRPRLAVCTSSAKWPGLTAPREELSDYAPRLLTIKIHPDKIREVIGKGGSTIQAITKETGTQIDIQDDGTIVIASVNAAAAQAAKARIEQITSDVEPGRIYEGKVAKIMDFGAFVTILPGKDGLVHVSQISSDRVEKVGDVLKEGDVVKVKVLEVDKQGRIRLSMKAVEEGDAVSAVIEYC
jgi:polyribonucleotide nucleotidyltransferase